MLKSKYASPLDNFVCHGVKSNLGDFNTYVLLVDETGQTLIEQVSADQSTILFCAMPTPASSQQNVIAAAINAFWAGNINEYSYGFLFQIQ